MARALETEVFADNGRGGHGAVVAGAAIFCLLARVRVGDLRQCTEEPILDEVGGAGFLETHFVSHKTARPGTKRALPIAAPSRGVLDFGWADAWMASRKAASVHCDLLGTLLPALGRSGEWLPIAFTTPELSAAFAAFC